MTRAVAAMRALYTVVARWRSTPAAVNLNPSSPERLARLEAAMARIRSVPGWDRPDPDEVVRGGRPRLPCADPVVARRRERQRKYTRRWLDRMPVREGQARCTLHRGRPDPSDDDRRTT